MRTETTTTEIFTLDELSDEAKEKALNNYICYGLGYDWWDHLYEDAETIGVKITSSDEVNISGKCRLAIEDVISNILTNHGTTCATHTTALEYKKAIDTLEASVTGECYTEEQDEEYAGIETEFLNDLLECYRVMITKEYEYLTSMEAFEESSESNEWEYLKDGNMY